MLGEKKDGQPPDAPNPWLDRIPEQYRSYHGKFFDEHDTLAKNYETAKTHQDWYESKYKPWADEHIAMPKSDYGQYQDSRNQQATEIFGEVGGHRGTVPHA